MKAFKVVVLAAAALAASISSASASTITYATLVDWIQGVGAGADPTRSVPANAYGAPDGSFLSLGLGGIGIFSFDTPFTGPGSVVEVTNGSVAGYPESVALYLGTSHASGGVTSVGDLVSEGFVYLTTISNLVAQSPGIEIPFDGIFNFLALVDVTSGGPSTDGFDVDAVGVSAVPLPAAGLLGLAGLGLLGGIKAFGRRGSKAGVAA
jgi:hypothetical protein